MDAVSYVSAATELVDRASSRAFALPMTAADAPAIRNAMLFVSSALQSSEPELVALPTDDFAKALHQSLSACLAAVELGAVATSPTTLLLLSGPTARRLAHAFSNLGSWLDRLSQQLIAHRTGSKSSEALQCAALALKGASFPNLDARAARALSLSLQLGALAEQQPPASSSSLAVEGGGLAGVQQQQQQYQVVREALAAVGVTRAELQDPQRCLQLSQEVSSLAATPGAASALTPDEAATIVLLAGALRGMAAEVAAAGTHTTCGPGGGGVTAAGAVATAAAHESAVGNGCPGRSTAGEQATVSSTEANSNAHELLVQQPSSAGQGALKEQLSSQCGVGGPIRDMSRASSAQPPRGRAVPPHSFVCPITQLLMRDPVTTEAGFSYERAAIEEWFRTHDKDPQNPGLQLASRAVKPNFALKGAIEEWLEQHGLTHEDVDRGAELLEGCASDVSAALSATAGTASRRYGPAGSTSGGSAAGASSAHAASAAYSTFAGVTQWYQVTDMDAAAKAHLKAAHVTPAVARALTEELGTVTMSDLVDGAVTEELLLALRLKPLDHRKLLQAVQAAEAMRAGDAGDGAAGAVGPGRTSYTGQQIRLLDYVTVAPGYVHVDDAGEGPLAPGKYGIVLLDDRSDHRPLKVRSLQAPFAAWWYQREALVSVPESAVAPERRIKFPYDASRPGAPVTPFTSEPGMLVRRGHDWAHAEDRNGEAGEVGMLVSSSEGGRLWNVMWAKGGRGSYATGKDNVWELSHLEVAVGAGPPESYCSGAPVVDEAGLAVGCCVVRGVHWTWEEQDGGEGTLGSVQLDDRAGYVAALWPNYRLARYSAGPLHGFDLNYAARPGEPVSVHTARQGVRVTRGRDWKWGGQDGGGRTGVLVRPVGLEPIWVVWEVEWSDGSRNSYRVGRNTWDLQVAQYESNGASGTLHPGCPVTLSSDYKRHGDAREGPLNPGKVGVVVEHRIVDTVSRVKVLHVRTGKEWWYNRVALRPLPPGLAVERSNGRMRLNRLGRIAFSGTCAPTGSGGGGISSSSNSCQDPSTGGDTGRSCRELFYCGALVHPCRCGACINGRCGPTSGCPCHACVELGGQVVNLDGTLSPVPPSACTAGGQGACRTRLA